MNRTKCRSRRCWLAAGFVSVLCTMPVGSRALADDSDLTTLQDEYTAAVKAWSKPGDGKAVDFRKHPALEFIPKFRKLAAKHKGTDDGLAAVKWVAENARMVGFDRDAVRKAYSWVAKTLTEDYAANPNVRDALKATGMAMYFDVPPARLHTLYDKIVEVNKDKECVATAMFSGAVLRLNPREPSDDAESERRKAIGQLKKLKSDYPDAEATKDAAPYLFEAEHLQIGMKAPDIVGKDVNDEEIRLSQFKGNVVVLDFWGFW